MSRKRPSVAPKTWSLLLLMHTVAPACDPAFDGDETLETESMGFTTEAETGGTTGETEDDPSSDTPSSRPAPVPPELRGMGLKQLCLPYWTNPTFSGYSTSTPPPEVPLPSCPPRPKP